MSRKIFGVVAGLVVWVTIVIVAGTIMRLSWSDYARVEIAMTFTLPMLIARLAISALATVAMGLVAAIIARQSKLVQLMPGVLLFVAFIPVHIALWQRFPVWYHLTFLLSLVPLTYVGGTISRWWQNNRTLHVLGHMRAV
jgi:hypothetical protein